MMQKMAAVLMALMMMAPAGALAAEDTAVTKQYVEGKVAEVQEDEQTFLIDDIHMGHVLVHVSDETQMLIDGGLAAGLYVVVEYSGAMTFSIPGQITAMSVMGYVMEGEVLSIEKDGKAILINTVRQGELIVNLPEGSVSAPVPGSYVRVYFNGVVATSLPGQITAWYIDSFVRFAGEVTEVSDQGILITAEDGQQMLARVDKGTLYADEVKAGVKAEVLYNGILTRSLPPQGRAVYLRLITE